ncbi:MAG: RagB/SusD family nutrient uptake outer membrane protein [Prolixibacteraceae bacterium]|jgi:starch-binding outer membrane protein, SusD/RagB family|nr:RagB/SusD family nutrient uptake outer membrane protein [Prolixibacteraceae bacterium]MBT6763016.1 RagB/SusD family nutrient uptake outer membrane protein [Prolixibacteraceae bacterium]MBT6998802.1 RagB/SusD family nutrient uptake outer membrane protein [Prolixibacteraceae bacterium]MBT7396264.1 RagB/SusD family nutrient uptake outer membrane protein [Prolixibacteraceae bacterium]
MKRIFIVLLGLVVLTACNGFLTEEPKSEMSVDQFFTNPTHAYNAVNILYRSGCTDFYRTGVYSGSRAMLGGYISGLFDNDYKGQEVHVQHCQDLTLNGDNLSAYFDGAWDACYDAISKANFLINNISQTPGLTDLEINNLTAQAKFFRAFNYYYLVKTFGNVPLILEEYSSLENIYVERSPSIQVYFQIVEDLKFAVEQAVEQGGLNDVAMPKNEFRISKGSAATLLADVYLNMGGYPVLENRYANAASITREIISSGNYSLITNGTTNNKSAFNIMRQSDNKDEYMYSIEYNSSISSSYWQPSICYPSEATSWGIFKYSVTNNAYKPTNEFLWIYDDEKDLRIQEKQFFHSSLTYLENEIEITKTFETAPYLWHDDDALFETGKTDKDIVVYRYAEVLLIAAEAIAKTEGVTPEAIGYLADVRSRAYWQTERNVIVDELTGLSEDDFIQQVWTERLREFSLEYKIWSDVQRTRKYPVTRETNKGTVSFVDVVGHTTIWGKLFNEKHLLFPISENERQRNPKLTQNPGY